MLSKVSKKKSSYVENVTVIKLKSKQKSGRSIYMQCWDLTIYFAILVHMQAAFIFHM